jgi:CrcB protein
MDRFYDREPPVGEGRRVFSAREEGSMSIFYIGLFGAMGCMSRYLVSGWTNGLTGKLWPYGTLAVNVLGSLLLAFIMEGSLRSTLLPNEIRMGITTGFIGGFTTFSTFSYETVRLLEESSYLAAGMNVLVNVVVCLFFASLGIFLARQL